MPDIKKIEQIAGQRIMAGFHGTGLNGDLSFFIDTIGVGGIILFSRNIESAGLAKELCHGASEYARSCALPPLLIAVDQEGGPVARLKPPGFTEFAGAPFIRNEHGARAFARITAKELVKTGINMNMAPVMDVALPGFDGIMAKRVFSGDPGRVAKLGSAVIRTLQTSGIHAIAKHFPGIGRTTLDSHLHRPDLEATLESLETFDLIPFTAAISANVSGIMLSHVRYTAIDPVWPASLSVEIAEKLLRTRMGYNGLVLTDDLEMGAVSNYYDMNTIVKRILEAQVDIALICKTKKHIEDAFESMCRQIAANALSMEKAVRSFERILALKYWRHQA